MLRVAVVEDESRYSDILVEYINSFSKDKHLECSIKHYKNAVYFLEEYRPQFDIVFMDIQMPYLSGMDAAHKLREIDSQVLLIFITAMSQYAIQGYEVNAFDYVLKPVSYPDFCLKLSRALRNLQAEKGAVQLVIEAVNGKVRVPVDEIRYIESMDHHLIYHVGKPDKTYTQYSAMNAIIDKMTGYDFARSHNSFLINLRYVQRISGYVVIVDGIELQISQPRKKEFLKSVMEYSERNVK